MDFYILLLAGCIFIFCAEEMKERMMLLRCYTIHLMVLL